MVKYLRFQTQWNRLYLSPLLTILIEQNQVLSNLPASLFETLPHRAGEKDSIRVRLQKEIIIHFVN